MRFPRHLQAALLAVVVVSGCTVTEDQVRAIQHRADQAQQVADAARNAAEIARQAVDTIEARLPDIRAAADQAVALARQIGSERLQAAAEAAVQRLATAEQDLAAARERVAQADEIAAAAQRAASDVRAEADQIEPGTSWLSVAGTIVGTIAGGLLAARGMPNAGRLLLNLTESRANRRRIATEVIMHESARLGYDPVDEVPTEKNFHHG